MIVVVADDISGAAEIAGIGWRFGLGAQVQARFAPADGVDLAVVNTNTRGVTEDVARGTVGAVAHELSGTDILWCYKKVDSVMRGHVCAELEVLMGSLEKPRVILAPANPSKGRTIVNGRYCIDGRPLHETDFANDLQYPARSCRVTDLLNIPRVWPVLVLRHAAYQGSEKGIIVAEAESQEDLSHWAARVDQDTLAAGGADFFAAILEDRIGPAGGRSISAITHTTGPKLFVCGSASESSRQAVRRAQRLGIAVCPMPDPLLGHVASPEPWIEQWGEDVLRSLRVDGRAIVAVPQPVVRDAQLAHTLSACMAMLVETVVGRMALGELILEGGATAEAVLAHLGWATLRVLGEYGPGVVQLCVSGQEDLLVTIKPGSYRWSAEIWDQHREGTSYAK